MFENKTKESRNKQPNAFSAIPAWYISFETQPRLEDNLKQYGINKIQHFPAVDGRRLNIFELAEGDMITPRVVEDVLDGRTSHSSIPSKGGLGCYMSHVNLWKKCVHENHDMMIVFEDDVDLQHFTKYQNLSTEIIEWLKQTPNGIYIDTNVSRYYHSSLQNKRAYFWFLHFYVITRGACENLLKRAYPIDIQVDHYIAHMATLKHVEIKGEHLLGQKLHYSQIQTPCWKCDLPNNINVPTLFKNAIIFLIISLVTWFIIKRVTYVKVNISK